MSKQVKTMQDLRDSKILYDKDLPRFGYMIISIIIFLFVFVTVWMCKTPKLYIVRGEGNVYNTDKNYIMSPYSGEIKEINIKEGVYVEKGTVLFTLASTELDLQKEQIDEQIATLKKQVAQYEKLSKCVADNKNYFDSANPEDDLYRSKYEFYESRRKQLKFDANTYKAYGYTDAAIKEEVLKNESRIEELYTGTLQEISQQIVGINSEIERLYIQENAIENARSGYQIKAPVSGTVHMSVNYKEGMIVQAGNVIGSISSDLDQYMIESYISAGDVPRIAVNQPVDIVVSGLIQSDYGVLTGVVKEIDSDMSTDDEGKAFFKVRILPDTDYLINKSGNKVNISNGMSVETRIIYDQITYMEYLLGALGFRAR